MYPLHYFATDANQNILFLENKESFKPLVVRNGDYWYLKEEDRQWIRDYSVKSFQACAPMKIEIELPGPDCLYQPSYSVSVPVVKKGVCIAMFGLCSVGEKKSWSWLYNKLKKRSRFSIRRFVSLLQITQSLEITSCILDIPMWLAETKLRELIIRRTQIYNPPFLLN